MKITVIYGNSRKGNTYRATQIFKDELSKCGAITFTEFFMPNDLPEFCTGCQLCLGNPHEICPHSKYVTPLLESILQSDALIIATPHCGASTMPASLKNLFDHLDFLVMTVAPRIEMFDKKAFILTTGSGATSTIGIIVKTLKHWGVNNIHSLGLRMFTDKWAKMPSRKQNKFESTLRKSAQSFYKTKHRRTYARTVFYYYLDKFIIKKYMGEGSFPFEYWRENDLFTKRPF
jgi:multimeric flavodoxin WrbA